jgi:dihydroorotate dehydrogenase electron transfer subunit
VFDEPARLADVVQVSADAFELVLSSPCIAQAARPGQFVNVLVPGGGFGQRVFESEAAWWAARPPSRPFLLRRPFSIYRAYAAAGDGPLDTIDLLIKVVGEGTRRLAETPVGTVLQVLGPLGRPFELPPPGVTAVLVAGGCGWASLGLLARELRGRGHPTYAFIGARTADTLPLRTALGPRPAGFLDALPESCVTSRELEELGIVVGLAAECGGQLFGGFVTDLLERFLASEHGRSAHVFGCGPWPMLRRVAELTMPSGAPCQLSFEKYMACGLGVCMSCVCEVVTPDGTPAHKRLCVDGPILRAEEVNWEEEMRDA